MKGKTYDLEKLSDNFDTEVSKRFYYDKQEYFDALSDFVTNFNRDLCNYTAAFVINSDHSREEFMKECFEIRAELTKVGTIGLIKLLSHLEDAARARSFQEFSDGQVNFKALLHICKDEINNAATRWKMTRKK
ncbi:MAG: hypothetical protein FWC70_11150 [Defluviitaleaceae bacterium]|nr:hypothetical protein [Defluviitaleaceae bacterium]